MARRTKKENPQPTLGIAEKLETNGLEQWLLDAANSIRGPVDAPKFKDYILPLIFVKRLSDVFDDEIERLSAKFGDRKTTLELVEDDHSLVRFHIPPKASWSEIRKLTSNIGQRLTEIIRAIAKANSSLQGVIDIVDFNATVSGQRIIEDGRLSTLIEILSRHRLGLKDVEPDVLGRAYEYLLRKFAEGQGQTAGEFFTPKEVGWLIARLLRPEQGMEVYDPACGSAGLLVKAQLTVKGTAEKVKRPLHLYGQELNHVTFAIAKMNMIIHDMEGEIAIGDTLRNPRFLNGSKLRTFDLVAANPMWNQDGYNDAFYESDPYGRFPFGYPSASTADWGWVQLILASLNDRGRAVIVLDTGAVWRGSGGNGTSREREVRSEVIRRDLVEAVILLPENLFYNATGPGILLCLNRRKPAHQNSRILLIDASREFKKGQPKNFISDTSATRILRAFRDWEEIEGFSRIVTVADVETRDWSLLPTLYVSEIAASDAGSLEQVLAAQEQSEDEISRARGNAAAILRALSTRNGTKGELRNTSVGPIPSEWRVVPLRDVVVKTYQRDPRKQPSQRFRYVDVSSVSNATLAIVDSKEYAGTDAPSRARKVVQARDVISLLSDLICGVSHVCQRTIMMNFVLLRSVCLERTKKNWTLTSCSSSSHRKSL